jgi:hypothetical protein
VAVGTWKLFHERRRAHRLLRQARVSVMVCTRGRAASAPEASRLRGIGAEGKREKRLVGGRRKGRWDCYPPFPVGVGTSVPQAALALVIASTGSKPISC